MIPVSGVLCGIYRKKSRTGLESPFVFFSNSSPLVEFSSTKEPCFLSFLSIKSGDKPENNLENFV